MSKSNNNASKSNPALNEMKNKVANELGVDLKSENLTAQEAGKVGGEMTKRLIQIAEDKLS